MSTNILVRVRGVVDPVKIILTSCLITMQNLVAVARAVCTHAGGPRIVGDAEALLVRVGAWLTT